MSRSGDGRSSLLVQVHAGWRKRQAFARIARTIDFEQGGAFFGSQFPYWLGLTGPGNPATGNIAAQGTARQTSAPAHGGNRVAAGRAGRGGCGKRNGAGQVEARRWNCARQGRARRGLDRIVTHVQGEVTALILEPHYARDHINSQHFHFALALADIQNERLVAGGRRWFGGRFDFQQDLGSAQNGGDALQFNAGWRNHGGRRGINHRRRRAERKNVPAHDGAIGIVLGESETGTDEAQADTDEREESQTSS